MTSINIFVGMSLLLAMAAADAQGVLDIKFDNDDTAEHFQQTADGVAWGTVGNQSCLIVNSQVATQTLKPVSVQPLKKYILTIRAAVDDTDTIETNDRIAEIASKTWGRSFAECELDFFDSSETETTFLRNGINPIPTSGISIVSRNFHDYVLVFYSPPNANTLRLSLSPRKRKLFVRSIQLEPETAEGTINCNPDFRYGPFNASGWHPGLEGRIFQAPDQRTVMKCGSESRSSFFAVDDESRYSFLCQGIGYESQSGKVIVTFYDEVGRELGYTHLFWDRDMENGATKEGIKPIPGSKFAMLQPSRVILTKVMVTQDGLPAP